MGLFHILMEHSFLQQEHDLHVWKKRLLLMVSYCFIHMWFERGRWIDTQIIFTTAVFTVNIQVNK